MTISRLLRDWQARGADRGGRAESEDGVMDDDRTLRDDRRRSQAWMWCAGHTTRRSRKDARRIGTSLGQAGGRASGGCLINAWIEKRDRVQS